MSDTGQTGRLRGMLKDTVYVVFGSYMTQAVSLIISVILARNLSTHNYGVYSNFMAAYMQGTLALSLGVVPIIQRYLPEFIGEGNRWRVRRLHWLGGIGHLVSGLLIAALAWIFRDGIAHWLNTPEFPDVLPYFIFFTIFKFEATVFDEMLTAHRRQMYRNLVTVGFQALKLILFVTLLPAEGELPLVGTLDRLFSFLVISNLIYALAYLLRILGLSQGKIEEGTDRSLPVRRMVRYGAIQYVTGLTLIALYTDIDVWIISHYRDPSEAGTFRLATQIVTALMGLVPMHLLLKVIIPVYVKEYSRSGDKLQLVKVFRFYNKTVSAFLFPVMIGVVLLAEPIIVHVYDPKWIGAVGPLQIFLSAMVITHFLNTMSFLPLMLEKPEITLWSRAFLIYHVAMAFWLIPKEGSLGGARGAALAAGSALILGYVLSYSILKRHIAVRIPWLADLRTLLYCLVMGAVVWLLRGFVDGIGSLLLVILAGMAVYGLLAFLLPVFNDEEKAKFNAAFGRRIFR